MRTRILTQTGIIVFLAFFAVLAIYPIFYMGAASLKTTFEFIRDPLSLPNDFSIASLQRGLLGGREQDSRREVDGRAA